MKQHSLAIPIFLGIVATACANAFFPYASLNTLAPLIALAAYRNELRTAIWISCWLGLILDLLNSQTRFGVYAVICCLTAIAAYAQRRHFYEDKPLAFALFSALISAILSLQYMLYMAAIDPHFTLSFKMFICDILLLSCLDGLYAFLWFFVPLHVIALFRRSGWRALLGQVI